MPQKIREVATMKNRKLFVWTGFCPDYSNGLAFAIAKDETDARKLVEQQMGYCPSVWGELKIHPLNERTRFAAGVHGV